MVHTMHLQKKKGLLGGKKDSLFSSLSLSLSLSQRVFVVVHFFWTVGSIEMIPTIDRNRYWSMVSSLIDSNQSKVMNER